MKHRTVELEGALLDQAVAKACGYLYDAALDEDFMVVSLDPQIPRSATDGTRRWCRIIVREDGTPHTPESAWAMRPTPRGESRVFAPSSRWEHGGPIIERERIGLTWDDIMERWNSEVVHPALPSGVQRSFALGPTALIAAMRAYVASKLGEEVELP